MAVSIVEEYPSTFREGIRPQTFYPSFEQEDECVEGAAFDSADPNIRIAKRLKTCKTRLIDALAQSAVTPLWLLKEYEQQLYKEAGDYDEESKLSTELASSLTEIRQCYQRITQEQASADTQAMCKTLSWFPFSFKDLSQLVNLHCYAGKQERAVSVQIRERIARINLQNSKQNVARFDEVLELNRQHFGRQECLFSNAPFDSHYIDSLLSAERHWLESRQKLVTANSGLVLFISNQYKGGFLDFDDLVQEGHTGLLKAADRYDYRLGFKFSTYAGYWIRQAISRSLSRSERVVRIPCGQVGLINKFFRDREQLLARTGKEPSLNDLAEHTGLSLNEIDKILAISQTAVPIEASPEDDEEAFAPLDFLEQHTFDTPGEIYAKSELERLLMHAITILSPREAKIICEHFGVDADRELTLREIGSELNLTRERVRQIEVEALNKINRHFGRQLSDFL